MKPEPLHLFIGDIHGGGVSAVAPAGNCQNTLQEKILEQFNIMVSEVKKEARGKAFVLNLGGDMVEGQHHNTRLFWGTAREQRNAVVELLKPLSNMASGIYSVDGTAAHVGELGDDDRSVAELLGAKTEHCRPFFRTETEGQVLNWAHHGIRVSPDPWNESNGMKKAIEVQYWRSLDRGIRPPSVIIRHNEHFSPKPITSRDITVAICPCWQLNTSYGNQLDASRTPDIGMILWWPRQNNRLERKLYHVEEA